MKKLLLSLVALLGAISLSAGTVTFTAGEDATASDEERTLSKDGVTLTITDGRFNTPEYRIYKTQTLTIQSGDMITKVEFVCTAEGVDKYGPGNFTAQDGYSYEGANGIWVGEGAESLTFEASGAQVRCSSITVTTAGGDTPVPTVAAPRFSPAAGTYHEPVEVTLTAADGCAIYYAFVTPVAQPSFVLYEEPFVINETTTIEAYAIDAAGLESDHVSATYTIEEAPATPTVATIAEFLATQPTEATTITGDITVVFDGNANGGNYNGLFLKDETGTLLAYFNRVERDDYAQGTVLAGITGVYGVYGGEPQMNNPVLGEVKAATTVTPTDATIAEINNAQSTNELVVIRNANVNVADKKASDATGEIAIYTRFKNVTMPEADLEGTNILALTARYNGTQQIYPIDFNYEGGEPQPQPAVEAPIFEPAAGTYTEPVTVTLSAADNCQIFYATAVATGASGATNFNLYEEPFTIEVSTNVSAYAIDPEGNQSETVSAQYIIKEDEPVEGDVVEVNCAEVEIVSFDGGISFTKDDIDFTLLKDEGSNDPIRNAANGDVRAYAKNTVNISANRNIVKAVFTLSQQGIKRLSAENTVDNGSLEGSINAEADPKTGELVWTGESPEFTITVGEKATLGTDEDTKAGQLCFTGVTLYLTGDVVDKLEAPTFDPLGGEYEEPVTVTLTAAEGADIYYLVSDLDAEGEGEYMLYEEPFTLTETCQVAAYAQNGDLRSATAVQIYLIGSTPGPEVPVLTIEEFLTQKPDYEISLENVTVVYDGLTDEGGYNALFVKDVTGTALLYFNKQERDIYAQGDILGEVKGTYGEYGEEPQLNADATSLADPVGFETVFPEDMTLAEINATESTNELVVISDVAVDVENKKLIDGEDEVAIFTRFKNVTMPEASIDKTNVLAMTARFKGTQQVYPLDFNYEKSGIDTINAKAAAAKGIYNLQGMKVTEMIPGQLYIVDGKKVIATR